MRKSKLIVGLGTAVTVLLLLSGCGGRGGDGEGSAEGGVTKPVAAAEDDAVRVIDQAVAHLNGHQWDKWIDLWVPEDRESFRQILEEQPEDIGLKNVKTARLIQRVDITGKVPVNPNYPFVAVRAYFVEMLLEVKTEYPAFMNGTNNHVVLLIKKTMDAPWMIRQWEASPNLAELLKAGKGPETTLEPKADQGSAD